MIAAAAKAVAGPAGSCAAADSPPLAGADADASNPDSVRGSFALLNPDSDEIDAWLAAPPQQLLALLLLRLKSVHGAVITECGAVTTAGSLNRVCDRCARGHHVVSVINATHSA